QNVPITARKACSMPTRTRRTWKPDSRGYYSRQLGWVRSPSGKFQQHKFLLGTDRNEAERRERKLRELWDIYSASCIEERPLWPDDLLDVARRIARGIPDISIARRPNEQEYVYAARIRKLQATYPVILFLPEDERGFEIGRGILDRFEAVPAPQSFTIEHFSPLNAEAEQAMRDAAKILVDAGVELPVELSAFSTSCEPRANPNDVRHTACFGRLVFLN
ncbi:MAG: hypothetical protein R3C49_27995, partial [Planctomycetaceae bacterium]